MNISVSDLIPHKEPMIFIKEVISTDLSKGELVAKLDTSSASIMYQKNIGGVASYSSLEYMAQAIGCLVGIYDKSKNPEKKPGIGFVLGSRNLKVYHPVLKEKDCNFIKIQEQFCDNNVASFECIIYNQDNISISEAIVNVFRPDNIVDFMKEYGP